MSVILAPDWTFSGYANLAVSAKRVSDRPMVTKIFVFFITKFGTCRNIQDQSIVKLGIVMLSSYVIFFGVAIVNICLSVN